MKLESAAIGNVPFSVYLRQHVTDLLPHEACVILRRRKDMKQFLLAKRIGICRAWLQRMETGYGSPERLIKYWTETHK